MSVYNSVVTKRTVILHCDNCSHMHEISDARPEAEIKELLPDGWMIVVITQSCHEETILICPGHKVSMTKGKWVIERDYTYKIPERKTAKEKGA